MYESDLHSSDMGMPVLTKVLSTFFIYFCLVGCTATGGSTTTTDGSVAAPQDFLNSEIVAGAAVAADGVSELSVTVRLLNSDSTPVVGFRPEYSIVSGSGVVAAPCSSSDSAGDAICILRASVAGVKRISVTNLPLELTKDIQFSALATSGSSVLAEASSSVQNGVGTGGFKVQSTVGSYFSETQGTGAGGWKVKSSVQGNLNK